MSPLCLLRLLPLNNNLAQDFLHFLICLLVLQPEAPAASSLHGTPRPEDEDDGDLNKALGVQRFQQILSPSAAVPDEQHHNYHEEDIECKLSVCCQPLALQMWPCGLYSTGLWLISGVCPRSDHRHSSHHIHRPLSKLPSEGRRKKSSKKRKKDKDLKSGPAPSSGPIEEGEDEEEEDEEGVDATAAPSEAGRGKDVEVRTGCGQSV